jgi:hypothetical protein
MPYVMGNLNRVLAGRVLTLITAVNFAKNFAVNLVVNFGLKLAVNCSANLVAGRSPCLTRSQLA